MSRAEGEADLNAIAREIWSWCVERNIYWSVAHIPGKSNITADKLLRKFNDDLEWALDVGILCQSRIYLGKLT